MTKQQKGFTLVELAIVLTIIGLLIGGILKGQQLITNARVTATAAEVNAYEAALTTFRDTYNAMPGDMPFAGRRIPGWNGSYPPTAGGGTYGDGIIGAANWNVISNQVVLAAADYPGGAAPSAAQETIFSWGQMAKAGLISGVTYNGDAVTVNNTAFGFTYPVSRMGGGWLIGYYDGAQAGFATRPGGFNPLISMSGTIITNTKNPQQNVYLESVAGRGVVTPAFAAQLDRKIDDGNPVGGTAQVYGVAASCYSVANADGGTATAPVYVERLASKDCTFMFRLQQ